MKAFLIALLITFLALGISMEMAEASETKQLDTRHVICATLAFNAGYDSKGQWYFRNHIAEFYEVDKARIRLIVDFTHKLVEERAVQSGVHIVQVHRDVFNEKCNMPFA